MREISGISSDIVTYGKIAGGGLPIGIVAGKDQVMDTFKQGVRMGGTFSCNPATLETGYRVLSMLSDDVYKYINAQGERFRSGIKYKSVGHGSISRIIFTDDKINNRKERDEKENQDKKKEFYRRSFDAGLYVGSNGIMFMSTAHTPDIVSKMIEIVNST